eukprot:2632521-Rhodomonas_salina.2
MRHGAARAISRSAACPRRSSWYERAICYARATRCPVLTFCIAACVHGPDLWHFPREPDPLARRHRVGWTVL